MTGEIRRTKDIRADRTNLRVQALKERTTVGSRAQVHYVTGKALNGVGIFKVVGVYKHYINVQIGEFVQSIQWHDVITVEK